MDFYVVDLERSIAHNRLYYWKGNRHGYTTNLQFAGLFSKENAEQIVSSDYDKTTIMIPQSLVFKILGEDMKPHEGAFN